MYDHNDWAILQLFTCPGGDTDGCPLWVSGYVPDQYNESEGAYSFNLNSSNRGVFDLDGGNNTSTLINMSGGTQAGATTITVDATTGFNDSGVAYIDGDK